MASGTSYFLDTSYQLVHELRATSIFELRVASYGLWYELTKTNRVILVAIAAEEEMFPSVRFTHKLIKNVSDFNTSVYLFYCKYPNLLRTKKNNYFQGCAP